jgi:hypothetical protein
MVLHRPFEPARLIGKVKIHLYGLRVNQALGSHLRLQSVALEHRLVTRWTRLLRGILGVENVCPLHSLIAPIGRAAVVGEFVAVIHMFDPDLHAQLPGVVVLGKFGQFFPREPKPPSGLRLLVRQQNATAPVSGQHPPAAIFGVALHRRYAYACDSRSRATARGAVGWTENSPRYTEVLDVAIRVVLHYDTGQQIISIRGDADDLYWRV